MAKGRPRARDTEPADLSGLYDRILAQLKPDREITAGEFLKRAFTFPQIERVKVQKYAGGTWNFAEDVDNISPAFDPNAIEPYLREKYGPWRFRLVPTVNGESITQHLVNLDGWQESEARSIQSLPTRATLTGASKPIAPGATSELLGLAKERVEIENANRLLKGLESDGRTAAVTADMTPITMMMQMMTGMMSMMKDTLTMSRGGMEPAKEDRFVQYLTDEVRFFREQMNKPAVARDPDALSRTITTIDNLLEKTLNTSLAQILTGAKDTEASGWAATIQGLIEGLKPHLEDIMGMIRSQGQPRRANVIPLRSVGAGASGSTQAPTEDDVAKNQAQLNAAFVEVINLLIDALRTKNFKTIDAILMNPPLRGQVDINPEVPAATYAVMFKTVDPRFATMQTEIAAYQEHMAKVIAEAEEGA